MSRNATECGNYRRRWWSRSCNRRSETGGENLAQRPVCGDVIILQVGVNEEADLQIFHMRITANYWIIPEASMLAPLWPYPHHEHTNGKKWETKEGGPAKGSEEWKLGRKALFFSSSASSVHSTSLGTAPCLTDVAPQAQMWQVQSSLQCQSSTSALYVTT